jgi:hypothetical protein
MKFIRTASVFAISALLVACGGGGGGDPTPAATATLVTGSGVVAGLGSYLPNDPLVDRYAPSSFAERQRAEPFSAVNSMSDFTFNDAGTKFKFNATGVSLDESTTNAADADVSVSVVVKGGAIWSQARFGFLAYDTTRISTEGREFWSRNVPFFIANVYSPEPLTDTTYATSGLAEGVGVDGDWVASLRCGVSATYTKSSQELVLTLADCFPGDPPGTVEGTIELRPTGSRATGFQRYFGGRSIKPSDAKYAFGGLEGQELVGAVSVSDGVTALQSIVFGVKK